LLELFENVTGVQFFLRHSVFNNAMRKCHQIVIIQVTGCNDMMT